MRQKREIEIRRDTLEELANRFDKIREYDAARLVGERVLALEWVLKEEIPPAKLKIGKKEKWIKSNKK